MRWSLDLALLAMLSCLSAAGPHRNPPVHVHVPSLGLALRGGGRPEFEYKGEAADFLAEVRELDTAGYGRCSPAVFTWSEEEEEVRLLPTWSCTPLQKMES